MNAVRKIAIGTGATLALMVALGAQAQESQQEDSSPLADQCVKMAAESADPETVDAAENHEIYATNADEYQKGEAFELRVDLLGEGNAKYNLTCTLDAGGDMTFEGMEASTSVESG